MSFWAEVTKEIFDRSVWAKQVMHLEGGRNQFESLFSWAALNQILEEQAIPSPRLRVLQHGKPIEPVRYQELRPNGYPGLIRPSGLYAALADGGTLVLDGIEELWRPLRHLAERVEAILHARVSINAYAAWGGMENGTGMHWDDANTLVLQISGPKYWKVWRPSVEFPIKGQRVPEPDGDCVPDWEGRLEQGQLLHVPRGWWHVVYPLKEPTLHVTLTIPSHTGLDLLRWFVNKLVGEAEVRRDVPILEGLSEQMQWMEAIGGKMRAAWSNDLLSDFVAQMDGASLPRTHVELSQIKKPEFIKLTKDSRLRLVGVRPIHFRSCEDGGAWFVFAGRRFGVTSQGQIALRILNDGGIHAVGELTRGFDDRDIAEFHEFLVGLVTKGVLICDAYNGAGGGFPANA